MFFSHWLYDADFLSINSCYQVNVQFYFHRVHVQKNLIMTNNFSHLSLIIHI